MFRVNIDKQGKENLNKYLIYLLIWVLILRLVVMLRGVVEYCMIDNVVFFFDYGIFGEMYVGWINVCV